jgi:hypothetical protein
MEQTSNDFSPRKFADGHLCAFDQWCILSGPEDKTAHGLSGGVQVTLCCDEETLLSIFSSARPAYALCCGKHQGDGVHVFRLHFACRYTHPG